MITTLSRKILGLDIRADSVSAVLVKNSLKGLWIEDKVRVEITEPMKKDDGGLSAALARVTSNLDVSGAVCIVSLPFNHISFRNIEVPFNKKKKIRQILPFELEPTLPFPIENLIIDFQIISHTDHPDRTEIIAGAIQQDELKSFLDILKSFQIDPEVVTIGGYSTAMGLANSLEFQENWILVDIDQNMASVYVAVSNQIQIVRSFRITSNLSEKQSSIGTHILHTIYASEERFGPESLPKCAYVTGCGLTNTGFEQDLEAQLNIPVRRLDFIKDGAVPIINHPVDSWHPVQMDNAFALCFTQTEGIRGLNFRKGPFATKKFWEDHTSDFIKSGILAAMVLVLLGVGFITDAYISGKKVTALDNQINALFKSTFPDISRIVDPLKQMRIEIEKEKKSTLFTGKTETNIRVIDIFNDISKLIPKETDVKFSKLVIGGGNVLVSGSTGTFNLVDDMKNRLEQVEMVTAVIITSANLDRSGNRVDFKLKIELD